MGIRGNCSSNHGAVERWLQNVPGDAEMVYGRCCRQSARPRASREASPMHVCVLIDGTFSILHAVRKMIRAHDHGREHLIVMRMGLNRGHGKTCGKCHNEHDHRNSTSKLKPHGQRHQSFMRYVQARLAAHHRTAFTRSNSFFPVLSAMRLDLDQSHDPSLNPNG